MLSSISGRQTLSASLKRIHMPMMNATHMATHTRMFISPHTEVTNGQSSEIILTKSPARKRQKGIHRVNEAFDTPRRIGTTP